MWGKDLLLVSIAYLLISFLLFWQITVNAGSAVASASGFAYTSLIALWQVPYNIFSLAPAFAAPGLFYPYGEALLQQGSMPLAGVLTYPLQVVNRTSAYNVLFFSSFMLSGLFMYVLAKRITKDSRAAFLAGVIFAFAPIHIAEAYGNLSMALVEFMPLFAYGCHIALTDKKRGFMGAAMAVLAFVLSAYFGDVRQAALLLFFMLAAVIIYATMYARSGFRMQLKRNSAAITAFVAPFVIAVAMLATLGPMPSSSTVSIVGSSASAASYLLPSTYDQLLGGTAQNQTFVYQGTAYQSSPFEVSTYIGYTAVALMAIALYYFWRDRKSVVLPLAILLLVLILFSLGPYMRLSSVASTPGPYTVLESLPFFSLITDPAALAIPAFICVALLSAIGFKRLASMTRFSELVLLCIVVALVLIEYNGTPLGGAVASALSVNTTIPSALSQIGASQGNFSLLALPALPYYAGNDPYRWQELASYYQTGIGKPLVGGYPEVVNASAQTALTDVPLIVETNYLEDGQGFLYLSPIQENYSDLTLFWLAAYHVGYVTVLRNAFNTTQQEVLLSYAYNEFGAPAYQDQNLSIFSVSAAEQRYLGSSTVAYTLGTWYPGFALCNPSRCNSLFESMWWGYAERGIVIVPRANATRAVLAAQMISYAQNASVYAIANGRLLERLNLTTTPQNITLSFNTTRGLNSVAFVLQNGTLDADNSSLTYGMRNVTISTN